ncbi:MAG TPA: iron chelate uptake ABC transporter family permease subunit [Pseudonocardiaceae bacterium]|nr:iron chelate uptake ABC transporter family permease subunit [Pseudonocardiaceae bacterium]
MTVLQAGRVALRLLPRSVVVCVATVVLIVVVAAITLTTGDFPMPLSALFGDGSALDEFVLNTLRLPRLLTGLLVGAALAVSGATFQSVSRNPLGSPDIVGFTQGAATGALIVIVVLHRSNTQIALGALIAGLATAIVVYLLAMKRGVQGYRLILIGIGVAAMLTAVNGYLITRANLADAQAAAVWLTGSLNGRDWSQVYPIAIALAILLPIALYLGRGLRMLELGDDTARSLGVPAERVRVGAVLVGVALAAIATASAGPIVFVALTAPQVTRRLTKAPGPNLVPTALTGALLLSASDLIAQRSFAADQLPVGVFTGVLGGIYLAWLLSREWRKGRG